MSSSIHLSPLWIPSVGALGSQVILTFFLPSRLHWRVSKQDGGGLVVFLMGCQLSPYAWSLWIFGIPQETLWEMEVLSLTWCTQHWGEKPWRNNWITPPTPPQGMCGHSQHPVLMTSARKHKHTRAHSQTQTEPTSWFQKGFSGLASVASWPRPHRGREGTWECGAKNTTTRPANRKCKQLHFGGLLMFAAKIQTNLKTKRKNKRKTYRYIDI